MKNYIFYHCTTINDYYERFVKTFCKIKNSGLLNNTENFHIVVNGESDKSFLLDSKITISKNKIHPNESITINKLKDFCAQNKDCNVLYLHCKGVTKSGAEAENVNAWIDLMEYFLIEKHENCINDLQTFDCVGLLLKYSPSIHFSGNFWWATANYICKLDHCADNYYAPEMWHLSKCEPKKIKCYYNTNKNLYHQKIEKKEYECQ